MSLETFWPDSFVKMPKPLKKLEKKDLPENAASEDCHAGDDAGQLDPALSRALQEMTEKITKVIDDKLGSLAQTVQAHSQQLEQTTVRLNEAENRIAEAESSVDTANARIQSLTRQVSSLAEHLDDIENRGRRKNLRIIGLPENAEGTNPTAYLQTWIPEFLGIETKSGMLKLERAHRIFMPKADARGRPRPLIVRFHNFQDKQRVMDASRRAAQKGDLMYNSCKISFYQDFSADVQRKRKEFYVVRQKLQQMGAQYVMLYPAKLRITIGKATKVCESPDEALAFIDSTK